MLGISLLVNVIVLVPVCAGLLRDAEWVQHAYGPKQSGRQILLAVYLAILILSVALLVREHRDVAVGLLLAQIVYKLLSPVTTGTLRNPVVISNLLIAVLHGTTVSVLATG